MAFWGHLAVALGCVGQQESQGQICQELLVGCAFVDICGNMWQFLVDQQAVDPCGLLNVVGQLFMIFHDYSKHRIAPENTSNIQ